MTRVINTKQIILGLLLTIGCSHQPANDKNIQELEIKLYFGAITSIDADAIVNSGNSRFEFFGGGAKYISQLVGKINGQDLPDRLRKKYFSMKEGNALLSSDTGMLKDKFKYIIHVSAVHTAGNPKKSLIPRNIHNEHPLIMGSYKSVKDSIKNSLLMANSNNINSINIPPLATSRGISKKVSIEALKDAINEYLEIVGYSKTLNKINYIIFINKKKEKDISKKYIVSQKKAWKDMWDFYFNGK